MASASLVWPENSVSLPRFKCEVCGTVLEGGSKSLPPHDRLIIYVYCHCCRAFVQHPISVVILSDGKNLELILESMVQELYHHCMNQLEHELANDTDRTSS